MCSVWTGPEMLQYQLRTLHSTLFCFHVRKGVAVPGPWCRGGRCLSPGSCFQRDWPEQEDSIRGVLSHSTHPEKQGTLINNNRFLLWQTLRNSMTTHPKIVSRKGRPFRNEGASVLSGGRGYIRAYPHVITYIKECVCTCPGLWCNFKNTSTLWSAERH